MDKKDNDFFNFPITLKKIEDLSKLQHGMTRISQLGQSFEEYFALDKDLLPTNEHSSAKDSPEAKNDTPTSNVYYLKPKTFEKPA